MKARTAAFTFPVLTALMALTLTVARQQEGGAPPDPTQESGPLVAEGPAPDLTLLYTGGVVGYVEPCG
ncbi:MAG: hypothetical protein ACREAA_15020 [Candidatus Polarisedimenticolia bacterium]